MYALIDLWPFPHIPGPSDWFKSLASMFFNSQVGMLRFAMSLVFGSSKATQEVLESDWFSYRLGGWTNLALDLFPLTVIVIMVTTLIKFRGYSFGASNYGRLLKAAVVIGIFVRCYYPAVGFIYSLQQEAYKLVAQHFAGGDLNSLVTKLADLANPADVVGMFLGAIIGWLVTFGVVTVSLYLFVGTLGIALLYPVVVALSPIGNVNGFFARLFHWANATLVTVIFSPLLMVFWLGLAIAGTEQAQGWFPVGSTYVGLALEIVALLLCFATPLTIMWLAYHSSLEIFGRTDSMLRNAVDIRSAAPLTFREARDRPDHNHRSGLRKVVTSAVVSTLDDRPSQPLSQKIADQVAMAAMATGQPEVAAIAKAVSRKLPTQKKPRTPPTSRGG